jgi:hypothetical protein
VGAVNLLATRNEKEGRASLPSYPIARRSRYKLASLTLTLNETNQLQWYQSLFSIISMFHSFPSHRMSEVESFSVNL